MNSAPFSHLLPPPPSPIRPPSSTLVRWLVTAFLLAGAALAAAGVTGNQAEEPSSESDEEEASWSWSSPDAWFIGGGFEYFSDSEERTYSLPFFLEYYPTDSLTLFLAVVHNRIDSKLPDEDSLSGLGDLYTAVEYEFLEEGDFWPSLSAIGGIRWPTATKSDLGDVRRDYDIGLLASEDFEEFSLEFEVLYSFVGDPDETDELGASFQIEWQFSDDFYLIAEVSRYIGTGKVRNLVGGGESDVETYIGLGWDVNEHLTLEQGGIFYEGGEWELAFYWEYSFGGE